MISKWTIVFTSTLLVFVESAFVETLQKCALDDPSCLKELIQNVLIDVGKGGIEEYNIKPVDPIDLKNLKVLIPELLTINVVEGEARGVKDCKIYNIVSDVKERRFFLEIICDLSIKVKVKLEEITPLVQKAFGGNSIEGGGNAKLKLDKLHLKLEYFYDIVKKEDGEIYFKVKPEKTIYKYEIGDGNMVADKMLFGGQDISKQFNEFFQENFKFVLKTFGKHFFDVAFDILNNIIQTFFDKTPAKYFISSELSP